MADPADANYDEERLGEDAVVDDGREMIHGDVGPTVEAAEDGYMQHLEQEEEKQREEHHVVTTEGVAALNSPPAPEEGTEIDRRQLDDQDTEVAEQFNAQEAERVDDALVVDPQNALSKLSFRHGRENEEAEPRQKKRRLTELAAQQEASTEGDYEDYEYDVENGEGNFVEDDDPALSRRRAIDERIQQIVKKKAPSSRKKKMDGDDLDAFHDELIIKLRNNMLLAADADFEANEAGEPALNKMRMLPQVVEVLQKAQLGESLVENGILEAIRRWLEPLPDKSLPAMNVQRAMMQALKALPIETSALKSSRVGRVVLFYTKCKRVDPQIARWAQQLVYEFVRPILRRSKSFADRHVGVAMGSSRKSGSSRQPQSSSINNLLRQSSQTSVAPQPYRKGDPNSQKLPVRTGGRIPEPISASFSVAPPSNPAERARTSTGPDMSSHVASSQAAGAKYREYKKKLQASENASRRV